MNNVKYNVLSLRLINSNGMDIKVYRVSFYLPIDGKKDYFFGSMSAIYGRFTKEQIGCDVRNLWNCRIRDGHPYKGQRCMISREPLYRKKRKLTFKSS